MLDPAHPVVAACLLGSRAEFEAKPEVALQHYQTAWALAEDDFGASIAAHYLARLQPDSQACLDWNRIALERGLRSPQAADWLPSLWLSLAEAHTANSDGASAAQSLAALAAWLDAHPDWPLAEPFRQALQRHQQAPSVQQA